MVTSMEIEASTEPYKQKMDAGFNLTLLNDLEAASRFIREVHPGAVPGVDSKFLSLLNAGFENILLLTGQIPVPAQGLAALNTYVAKFSDDHLVVGMREEYSALPRWAGWTAVAVGPRYLVRHAASGWSAPLPQIGMQLTHCDEEPIDGYLESRIGPYIDRRYTLEGVRNKLVTLLTNRVANVPLPDSSLPQRCTFRSSTGTSLTLPTNWESSDIGLRMQAYVRPPPGLEKWMTGYWVYANDFDPLSPSRGAFEKLRAEVEKIPHDAPFVVFDTRGNQGGSGIYGFELLSALLKDATPKADVASRARWRVSKHLIDQLRSELARATVNDPSSPRNKALSATLETLTIAHEDGKEFVDDISALAMPPPPIGIPFNGRVVIVTDPDCASACLDFVDMVRRVPGVLHVGRETSGDTNYLEVIRFSLPSQRTLVVPTKVWEHRKRGVNESVRPHYEYNGDIRETAKLRKWLASILQKH